MTTDFSPFIYGLVDPQDPGHVRYVGMATVRSSRPLEHAKNAKKPSANETHFVRWVRKLQNEGREYSVLILEELSPGTDRRFLGEVEKLYISALSKIGHQLTNVSEGGWGGYSGPEAQAKTAAAMVGNAHGRGTIHPESSRKSRSVALRQYYADPANKATLSKAIRNAQTPEVLAKRQARKGEKRSEETKAKISAAKKGHKYGPMPEEIRQKISASMLGHAVSADTRLKQSVGVRAAFAKRKEDAPALQGE